MVPLKTMVASQTQATAPGVLSDGESNALSLPSLAAAEFGWWLGTCLLVVPSDVCGGRVWPRAQMPLLQVEILQGLQGSNAKAQLVALWSITTCAATSQGPGRCHCQLLPQWERTAAFTYCLSPTKSMQKLMVWDISYSCES